MEDISLPVKAAKADSERRRSSAPFVLMPGRCCSWLLKTTMPGFVAEMRFDRDACLFTEARFRDLHGHGGVRSAHERAVVENRSTRSAETGPGDDAGSPAGWQRSSCVTWFTTH